MSMDTLRPNVIPPLNEVTLLNDILQNSSVPKSYPKPHITPVSSKTNNDALMAVKMDPAVLEAQVTVNTPKKETPAPIYSPSQAANTDEQQNETDENGSLEDIVSMHKTALLALSSDHFNLLVNYVDTIRRQRFHIQRQMECGFCKNNGRAEMWYSTHQLKDKRGRVRCPVLRSYSCPYCGATGDHAHTISYCPEKFW